MQLERKLDLTGGWERIVNDVSRHNARVRRDEEQKAQEKVKMIRTIIHLALGAICTVALACADLVAHWVAVPAAVVLVCIACFIGGRLHEKY